jgi:hypothetical protein
MLILPPYNTFLGFYFFPKKPKKTYFATKFDFFYKSK